jgi:hypothetical protein
MFYTMYHSVIQWVFDKLNGYSKYLMSYDDLTDIITAELQALFEGEYPNIPQHCFFNQKNKYLVLYQNKTDEIIGCCIYTPLTVEKDTISDTIVLIWGIVIQQSDKEYQLIDLIYTAIDQVPSTLYGVLQTKYGTAPYIPEFKEEPFLTTLYQGQLREYAHNPTSSVRIFNFHHKTTN